MHDAVKNWEKHFLEINPSDNRTKQRMFVISNLNLRRKKWLFENLKWLETFLQTKIKIL